MKPIILLLTCEHAVNTIPAEFKTLFSKAQDLLQSHRGYDMGALEIAKHLQEQFNCQLLQAQASRLLIDCNRSLSNANCFSEISHALPWEAKQAVIAEYYQPLRQHTLRLAQQYIDKGQRVLHISVHSFTPSLNNQQRQAEIGLLYDPRRTTEKKLAQQWQQQLKKLSPDYRIRMNYPYLGRNDGHCTALRKLFTTEQYMGIEIESNQSLTEKPTQLNILKQLFADSLLPQLFKL